MLILLIQNDGTGTDQAANYTYEVRVNYHVIERGRVEGHNRKDGWRELVRLILEAKYVTTKQNNLSHS